MNKIFKVIWNHATQTWTAVSEVSKAKGKSKSSTNKKVSLLAISVATAVSTMLGNAQAASIYQFQGGTVSQTADQTAKVSAQVAVGKDSEVKHAFGIALGEKAHTETSGGISIGYNSSTYNDPQGGTKISAPHQSAIAIGVNTKAAAGSVVIGGSSHAYTGSGTLFAVVIGNEASGDATGATVVGNGGHANKAYTTAMGKNTLADSDYASAFGHETKATGYASTALGRGAKSSGGSSIAIGGSGAVLGSSYDSAQAESDWGIAIGHTSRVTAGANNGTALGRGAEVHAADASALGTKNVVRGTNSTAVGSNNTITAKNAFVLGSNVINNKENSVVLGANSATAGSHAINTCSTATIGNVKFDQFAGAVKNDGDFVSIGAPKNERKLINVAAGKVEHDSTEAINGSQLYSIAKTLAAHSFNVKSTNINDPDAPTLRGTVGRNGNITFVDGSFTTTCVTGANDNLNVTFHVIQQGLKNNDNGSVAVNSTNIAGKQHGFTTATQVQNAINNSGWNIQGSGSQVGLVKPSNNVNFNNGTATTATVNRTGDTYNVKYDVNYGRGLDVVENKLVAKVSDITEGNNITIENKDGTYKISATDTNTQASVTKANNSPITVTSRNNNNGTTQYELDIAIDGTTIKKTDDGKLAAIIPAGKITKVEQGKGVTVTPNQDGDTTTYTVNANVSDIAGGKNVKVSKNDGTYTINAYDVNVNAGENIRLVDKVVDKDNGITTYTVNAASYTGGTGVTVTGDKTNGFKINANVTDIKGEGSVTVDRDVTTGVYTVKGTDTNTQAKVYSTDKTVSVTPKKEGTVNPEFDLSVNVDGKTITKDKNGVLSAKKVEIENGDNITVTPKGDFGYTISANNTQASVAKADGSPITITESDNGNGTKQYNLDVAVDGTTIQKKGGVLSAIIPAVANTALTVNANGKVETPVDADKTKYVQAGDLAETINNVSFDTAVGKDKESKFNDGDTTTGDTKVKAGDTLTFKSGKNLKVKQDGKNFTYATEDDVSFNKVESKTVVIGDPTSADKGTTLTSNENGLSVGGDKITNVAPGKLSDDSTDAVNGSQLYATNNNVTNLNNTVAKGLNFAGNDNKAINKKLGDTLNIVGGYTDPAKASNKNVIVTNDGGNLSINIAENPEFKGVTLKEGNNVVNLTTNDGGLKLSNGTNPVKISGVANGTEDNDAVNVAQLKDQKWVLTTSKDGGEVDGTSKFEVKNGTEVDISAGTGIKLQQKDGKITISSLAKDPETTDLTVTNGKVDKVESANSNKFVTASNIANTINNVSWTLQNNSNNVTDVKAGDKVNFIDGTGTTVNTKMDNGVAKIAIDIATTTISLDPDNSGKVKVADTGNKFATAENVANAINNASFKTAVGRDNEAFTDQLSEGDDKSIQAGDTLTFKSGKNLKVKQVGTAFTYATADDVSFNKVESKTVVIGDPASGDTSTTLTSGKDGLDVGGDKITNVAPGKLSDDSTDAVNGSQLYATNNNVTNLNNTVAKGLNFAGNDNKAINKKLGDTLNIVGGYTDPAKASNKNVIVTNKDGNLSINIAENPEFKGVTLKEGNNVVNLTLKGSDLAINGGGEAAKITNVKDGDISSTSKDAINGSQLYNVTETINKGWNVQAEKVVGSTGKVLDATNTEVNSTDEEKIAMGDTVKFEAGDNIVLTHKGKNLAIATSQNLSVKTIKAGEKGKDGKDGVDGKIGVNGADGSAVVLNGKDGSIGLNGKDGKDGISIKSEQGEKGLAGNDGKDGESKTRIVYVKPNGEKETVATLNDGLKFKGDNETVIDRKLGTQLNITGGAKEADLTENNIGVVSNAGKDGLNVKLAKDINLTKDGSLTIGDTKLENGGLTITGGPSVTNGGINAGGKKITNVAEGTDDTDAVNVKQLKDSSNATLSKMGFNLTGKEEGTGKFTVDPTLNDEAKRIKHNETFNLNAGNNIHIKQVENGFEVSTGHNIVVGEKGKDGKDGVDGKIGVNGADGSAVVLNGKDGSIGLNGKDGKDGISIKSEQGAKGLDGNDGKDGESKTRLVYEKPNGDKETVATLNDGLTFAGDTGTESKRKLGEKVTVRGGQKDRSKLSDKPNIGVVSDGQGHLDVKLAKDVDLGSDGSLKVAGVTIDNKGINAGNKVISNVAAGVKDTDAVNVGQLKGFANNVNNHLNKLGDQVAKNRKLADAGTASVAAMSNIPQPFLPGRSGVGVGVGSRGGQNAVAIGYSRISDNAKHIIKISASMDSQRKSTLGAGYLYQW